MRTSAWAYGESRTFPFKSIFNRQFARVWPRVIHSCGEFCVCLVSIKIEHQRLRRIKCTSETFRKPLGKRGVEWLLVRCNNLEDRLGLFTPFGTILLKKARHEASPLYVLNASRRLLMLTTFQC